jgi:hypothetical protein
MEIDNMGHFAKVTNGKVVQVIVAEPDFFNTLVDSSPGQWIQTSYNTHGNVHTNGGIALRGNYAGIGYIYDSVNDVFYPQQPYPSWILNETIWAWEAPVPMPTGDKLYKWNETILNWEEIS